MLTSAATVTRLRRQAAQLRAKKSGTHVSVWVANEPGPRMMSREAADILESIAPDDLLRGRALAIYLVEKSADDHFYGAWKGGSKAAGGGPAGKAPATPPDRSRLDHAQKALTRTEWNPDDTAWESAGNPAYFLNQALGVVADGAPERGKPFTGHLAPPSKYEKYHRVLFYGEDGSPAAYVKVRAPSEHMSGSILGVLVHPAQRGKGMGQRLYDWVQDHTELNLYDAIGHSQSFTPAGKAFALAWLQHRVKIEAERAGIRESDDDHFYGPWVGGSKAQGGHPAGKAPEKPKVDPAAAQRIATATASRDRAATQLGYLPWMADRKDWQTDIKAARDHGAPLTSTPNSGWIGEPRPGDPFGRRRVLYYGADGKPAGSIVINHRDNAITHVMVHPERRGEGIGKAMYDWAQDHGGQDMYALVGASRAFTKAGKAFAVSWLEHRIKVETERAGVREAAKDDDHPYGAWSGGKASAGGHPGRTPTLAGRRAEMADRVGAENVGNIALVRRRSAAPDLSTEAGRQAAIAGAFEGATERHRRVEAERKAAEATQADRARTTGTPVKKARPEAAEIALARAKGEAGKTKWSVDEHDFDRSGRASLSYWTGKMEGEPNTYHVFRHPGSPGATVMWLADDGKVGAMLNIGEHRFGREGNKVTVIETVAVRPSLKGKGIGKAFYDHIQDHTDIDLYKVIGQSESFTKQGKAFAVSWLQHRVELETRRAAGIREAGDDHFYGPWGGGKASAGGGPVAKGGPRFDSGGAMLPEHEDRLNERLGVLHGRYPVWHDLEVKVAASDEVAAVKGTGTPAMYRGGNIHVITKDFETPEAATRFEQMGKGLGGGAGYLADATIEGVVTHEYGHAVQHYLSIKGGLDRSRQRSWDKWWEGAQTAYRTPGRKLISGRSLDSPKELFAELFAHAMAGKGDPYGMLSALDRAYAPRKVREAAAAESDTADACSWAGRGRARALWGAVAGVREASSDDHYYGPWHGGSRASGGGPGRLPTKAARVADLASKVGAENVGNVALLRTGAKDAARDEHFTLAGDRRTDAAAFKPAATQADAEARFKALDTFPTITHPETGKPMDNGYFRHLPLDQRNAVLAEAERLHAEGYRAKVGFGVPVVGADVPGQASGGNSDHWGRIEIRASDTTPGKLGAHNVRDTFAHEYMHVVEGSAGGYNLNASSAERARIQAVVDRKENLRRSILADLGAQGRDDPAVSRHVSFYARKGANDGELWAEYAAMVASPGYRRGTLPRDHEWMQLLRDEGLFVPPSGSQWADLREAASDDHFYGAWEGGSKAEGGHPAGKPATAVAERPDQRPQWMRDLGIGAPPDPAPPGYASAAEARQVQAAVVELGSGQQDHETAHIIRQGTMGVEASITTGRERSVSFTPVEIASMRGAHVIHNHPSGESFSTNDILMAIRSDAAGIHAVGTDKLGRKWHHSALRPPTGWPTVAALQAAYTPALRAVESAERQGVIAAMKAASRADQMRAAMQSQIRSAAEHNHLTWDRVLGELGVAYRRQSW